MEWIYIVMIVFLFTLAIFDLWVGVSNDAVNFMNSAIGSRVASFKTIVFVAAVGVFLGATMSDGMMEIARHGIMCPEQFSFSEVMTIFVAVITTDIVLLNIFNTLGMPTSTTVSMIFNLLGSTSAVALMKNLHGATLPYSSYLNTDKVLEVIMAIFLSVAIAFFFGLLIQFLVRIIFTFKFREHLRSKIGIFGGVAVTAILFFMVFKGMKNVPLITPQIHAFIDAHTLPLLAACFVVFSLLMQFLYLLKINVFKVIILLGTFALAAAFAGNDLVNFMGVPLAGYSAFMDFSASGSTDATHYMMNSLNGPANTPIYFLLGAGTVMVIALAKSKKAKNVTKTQVGLSSQQQGDEMFGSSKIARSLVRSACAANDMLCRFTPAPVLTFINSRFRPLDSNEQVDYDLIRASVNIVVAALLIALGTSLKLPLSTTYVTFMVAMGASLADRAWSRESAVFRVTGVLTVIGGWFITAGMAFIACFIICIIMYFGGIAAMAIVIVLAISSLANSSRFFRNQKKDAKDGDLLFYEIMRTTDKGAVLPMLRKHVGISSAEFVHNFATIMQKLTDGLFNERLHLLRTAQNELHNDKTELKNLRRRETVCLKQTLTVDVIRFTTSFHLIHNSLYQLRYGLLRIAEPALEHVDNHFTPIKQEQFEKFIPIRDRIIELCNVVSEDLRQQIPTHAKIIFNEAQEIEQSIKGFRQELVLAELNEAEGEYNSTALLLHVAEESEQFTLQLETLFNNCREFFGQE